MYFVFELIGTVAFAISGAMAAVRKEMDILGVMMLGITTAVGGGIIRDVLLGVTPPQALQNPLYAIVSAVVSLIVFLPFIRRHIDVDHMAFVVVDALGLGTFTVVGIAAASGLSHPVTKIFIGVLTGVGGGVLRDIFSAKKPMIFVKRFYAAASICGAIVCVAAHPLGRDCAMLLGIAVIVILRILAAKFKWHLPRATEKESGNQ